MCGICGFVNFKDNTSSDTLVWMNRAISHRGPDDEGYISVTEGAISSFSGKDSCQVIRDRYPDVGTAGNVSIGLGFRRLAILDKSSAGHQPMVDSSGKVAITLNGEIYNFRALREELRALGHDFIGHSDSEVVLKAYLQWGIDMLSRLNGMFALAVIDLMSRKVFLVRDRLGLKPLVYTSNEGALIWASEIKGVLPFPGAHQGVDYNNLAKNYIFQSSPLDRTCFRNIYRLSPGHYLEYSLDKCSLEKNKYWELPRYQAGHIFDRQEVLGKIEWQLKTAVERQLVSDVPLISMMSGGIDSTTVTALAARSVAGLSAYTLKYEDVDFNNEYTIAQSLAHRLSIKHLIQEISFKAFEPCILPSLKHFEEPYSQLEVVFSTAAFIRSHGFVVALSGNGADELFGGYYYMKRFRKWQQLQKIKTLVNWLPDINSTTKKLKKYSRQSRIIDYYTSQQPGMKTEDLDTVFFSRDMAEEVDDYLEEIAYDESFYQEAYEPMYHYDMNFSVSSHHVFRDDMSAMYSGVEVRYPFLDHELIELVSRLPMDWRYGGKLNKPLLRDIAFRYIPTQSLELPKKGFVLPAFQWFQKNKSFREFIYDHINTLVMRPEFDMDKIRNWTKYVSDESHFQKIWQLVSTEVFLKTYMDDPCL